MIYFNRVKGTSWNVEYNEVYTNKFKHLLELKTYNNVSLVQKINYISKNHLKLLLKCEITIKTVNAHKQKALVSWLVGSLIAYTKITVYIRPVKWWI